MQRQRFLFSALAVLTVWRFALLPTCDLSPSEAMSAVAAAQPGWTWQGTSPLLTILARIGMLVCGHSEYGVRLFAPLLALAASLLTWRLAKELFDEQAAAWSVVILNVIPAFNLSAIYLTVGSVAFAAHAGLALSLALALRRSDKWHRAWIGAAGCMAALVFADGGNFVALAAAVCALLITPAWRQRLVTPEFWIVVAAWGAGIVAWALWIHSHDWLLGGLGGWWPEWRIVPDLFRWLLLASPVLVYLIWLECRHLGKGIRYGALDTHTQFVFGFVIPLLVADFAWGTWRGWPDTGHATWLLFTAVLLARRNWQVLPVSTEAKISIRTTALALAAAQSLLLMRTDLFRSAGLPWAFSQRMDERHTYTRFHFADPSGNMNGWRETAKIVSKIIASDPKNEWFLIADQWQLAAPVAFYLGKGVRPAVRIHQNGTVAEWPRHDRMLARPGGNALFITDDVRCKAVPPAVARSFEQTKIISIADIMHGGHKVRTLKIFACLHYRAPDL
jgi:Dolichyl-phosphate-mannose-protein mannosyltransferase